MLHPDGLFLVSTPNKGIFIEGNPFHTKEFTFTEFEGLLGSYYSHVATLAQDNWITSAIFAPSTHEKADRPILAWHDHLSRTHLVKSGSEQKYGT